MFIDGAYLERVCQDALADRSGGQRVPLALDFRRLPAVLAGIKPWRVFYYHCMPYREDPPLPAEQAAYDAKASFIRFVEALPRWQVREGRLEARGRGADRVIVQKRVDVQLAVDLVRLAWRKEIGRAVLVAGDADFVPAVADARAAGVEVTLRHEPSTTHGDLVAACTDARALRRDELGTIRLARGGGSG